MAENHGQVGDWVVQVADGSRVHVHEMADGSMLVHRDPTSPERGLLPAAWHWLTESWSGRAVVGIGVFAGFVAAVVKLARR